MEVAEFSLLSMFSTRIRNANENRRNNSMFELLNFGFSGIWFDVCCSRRVRARVGVSALLTRVVVIVFRVDN